MAATAAIDVDAVDRDIEARRLEAAVGLIWAEIKGLLAKLRIKPGPWCKAELDVSSTSMDRRLRLHKHFGVYEDARREAGPGNSGLAYALLLIKVSLRATKKHGLPFRSHTNTGERLDISLAEHLCGNASEMLRTLPNKKYHCAVTSPPNFGGSSDYENSRQIGCEQTVEEYVAKLVLTFREVRRVLRDDGVLWLVIGDKLGTGGSAGKWAPETKDIRRGSSGKSAVPAGTPRPAVGRKKDLIGVPHRVVQALQDDGWLLRSEIVWSKSSARPELAKDRPTRAHDYIFMLVKEEYNFNPEFIAERSATGRTNAGNLQRDGVTRHELLAHNLRNRGDSETRNSRDIWYIRSHYYHGPHRATFPPMLPAKCILTSCPPGQVCDVLDPFSGAGTTVMVALQLGHRATGIDLNSDYISEAQERIAAAPATFTLPHEAGTQPHHHRLKNALSRALAAEDRGKRMADELAKHAPGSQVLVDYDKEIDDLAFPMAPATVPSPKILKARIGECDLFRGHCFQVMAGLEPEILDLLVGDLPYGMTKAPWDVALDLRLFFQHALRLLRPNGVILMCATEPFSSDLVHACRELFRDRWHWWDNGPVDNFLHSACHPLKRGEDVLMFSPAGTDFTFNPQKIPLAQPRHEWLPQIGSSLHRRPEHVRLPSEPTQYEYSHPVNLLFFPTTPGDRQMPTQKPLAMLRYFIETYSNPGDLVGDFTLGVGTTAVAALQADRRFVGAERVTRHFNIAVDRVRNLSVASTVAPELAAT